jgi:hypothetical protein
MNRDVSWKKVLAFSSSTEDDLVKCLAQSAETYSAPSVKFEHGLTGQAIQLAFDVLFEIASRQDSDFLIYDLARSDAAVKEPVLFVSSGCTSDLVTDLLAALTDGTLGSKLPPWAGVQTSPIANEPFLQQLENRGAQKARGMLELRIWPDQRLISEFYRTDPLADELKRSFTTGLSGLDPVPEDADNLDQRSKWFRRRSGRE